MVSCCVDRDEIKAQFTKGVKLFPLEDGIETDVRAVCDPVFVFGVPLDDGYKPSFFADNYQVEAFISQCLMDCHLCVQFACVVLRVFEVDSVVDKHGVVPFVGCSG